MRYRLTSSIMLLALALTAAVAAWHFGIGTPGTGPQLAVAQGGEKVAFVSYNADWKAINQGSYRRDKVTLTGYWLMPAASESPSPLVIMLHGSDGLSDHQLRYARALNDRGIGAFLVDSFGPRGVTDTIGNQTRVSAYSMVVDAYQALKLAARDPRVDSRRIAVLGWSKGGTVADWTARDWYRQRLSAKGLRFAAHIAFYPWCGEQPARIALTGAPLLFLTAELDDWSGSEPCERHVARLIKAGHEADIVVYPGAHHGFDYAGSFRTYLAEAINWSGCDYLFREEGFVIAASGAFRNWSKYDSYLAGCTRQGAHLASHGPSREKAMVELMNFLSYAFDR